MAWERGYYYRVRKVNGRVRRDYFGKGPFARLVAEIEAEIRVSRRAEAEARKAELAQQHALAAQVAELCDHANLLARAALLAAGYHQHKRGEWRRKRVERPAGAC